MLTYTCIRDTWLNLVPVRPKVSKQGPNSFSLLAQGYSDTRARCDPNTNVKFFLSMLLVGASFDDTKILV